MAVTEADRAFEAFMRRARWPVFLVGLLLMGGFVLCLLTANPMGGALFLGMFVFAIGWNVFAAFHRHRLRARFADTPVTDRVRDQRSGAFVEVAVAPTPRPLIDRMWRGVRSIVSSTPVTASTAVALSDVEQQLVQVTADEDMACAWYWAPGGPGVRWSRVQRRTRRQASLQTSGVLGADGERTTFSGRIGPEGVLPIAIVHVVVFGVGGALAVVGSLVSFAFPTVDHGGSVFLLLWGSFGMVFMSTFVLSVERSLRTHEHILRTVFGEDVQIGGAVRDLRA